MLKIGDIVRINHKNDEHAMPDSPALNLRGSICQITKVFPDLYHPQETIYNFKIIELHAEKPEIVDESDGELNWKERHFELVKEEHIEENDVINLFSE